MATQSFEQLIAGANKIKQNQLPESNTAGLVGEQLIQMVNKQKDEETERVKSMSEYNVSVMHPTGGIGGSEKYTFETAIRQIPNLLRRRAIKCAFIGTDGKSYVCEYQGGTYTDKANWLRVDGEEIHSQRKAVESAKEEALNKINQQKITPDMLSQETKDLINASGGGTITNNADGTDLASAQVDGVNVIRFADRKHEPSKLNGLGKVYLRADIKNGKRILTQGMVSADNTIYVVRDDLDLNGATINIPDGCVLQFEGGRLDNGVVAGRYSIGNIMVVNSLDSFVKSKISRSLGISTIIKTLGYYSPYDGGGAMYQIVPTSSVDKELTSYDIGNGLSLILIDDDNNVKKHGVKYEDELFADNNAAIIKKIILSKYKGRHKPKSIYFPSGRVYVGNIHLSASEFNIGANNICVLVGDGRLSNYDVMVTTTILCTGDFITWEHYGYVEAQDICFISKKALNGVCFGHKESDNTSTGECNIAIRNVVISGFKYGFKASNKCTCSGSYVLYTTIKHCLYGMCFGASCNRFYSIDLNILGNGCGLYGLRGQNIRLENTHIGLASNEVMYNTLDKLCGVHGTGFTMVNTYCEDYGGVAGELKKKYAFIHIDSREGSWGVRTIIDGFSFVFVKDRYKFIRFYVRDSQGNMRKGLYANRCFVVLKNCESSWNNVERSAFEFFDDSGQSDSWEDAGVYRLGIVKDSLDIVQTVIHKSATEKIVFLKNLHVYDSHFVIQILGKDFKNNSSTVDRWNLKWTYLEKDACCKYYLRNGMSDVNLPDNEIKFCTPVWYPSGYNDYQVDKRKPVMMSGNISIQGVTDKQSFIGKSLYLAENRFEFTEDMFSGENLNIPFSIPLHYVSGTLYISASSSFNDTELKKIKITLNIRYPNTEVI